MDDEEKCDWCGHARRLHTAHGHCVAHKEIELRQTWRCQCTGFQTPKAATFELMDQDDQADRWGD